jgi:hypothetical protein
MVGIKYTVFGGGSKKEVFTDLSVRLMKSIAGSEFHKSFIESVCVFDEKGKTILYLKKTDNGIIRQEA